MLCCWLNCDCEHHRLQGVLHRVLNSLNLTSVSSLTIVMTAGDMGRMQASLSGTAEQADASSLPAQPSL